jgi:hypothetical protein
MSAAILDQETINWISVEQQLPDAETTVLVHAPGADEPVWLGWYDGFFWFAVTGDGYGDEDEIAAEVKAWATMPGGPA